MSQRKVSQLGARVGDELDRLVGEPRAVPYLNRLHAQTQRVRLTVEQLSQQELEDHVYVELVPPYWVRR